MIRLLKIVIVLVIVAVLVNDGGRYAQSVIDLRSSTGQVLDQAVTHTRGVSQAEFANTLAALAATQRIRVTQFGTSPTAVHIWTEEDVYGTWLIGPYLAIARGIPFDRAFATPVVVKYDAEENIK
jgi:hypothetical protein